MIWRDLKRAGSTIGIVSVMGLAGCGSSGDSDAMPPAALRASTESAPVAATPATTPARVRPVVQVEPVEVDSVDALVDELSDNALADLAVGEWELGRFEAMSIAIEARDDEVCISADHDDGSSSRSCSDRDTAPALLTMGYIPPDPGAALDMLVLTSSEYDIAYLVDDLPCSMSRFDVRDLGVSVSACPLPAGARSFELVTTAHDGTRILVRLPVPDDDFVTEVEPINVRTAP